MKGIDISHYQGTIIWNKLANSDVQFAFQKCTQGTAYVDATYATNKAGARASGVLFGSYHFANGGNALAEADHFVKTVGNMDVGELLALDYETNAVKPDWCKIFLDRIYEKTGIRPFLYTNEARVLALDWKSVSADYPLWVAKYGTNNGTMQKPPKAGVWSDWTIWQYTSKGKSVGIVGAVDLDTFDGSVADLKKYGKPSPPPPPTNDHSLIHPIREKPTDPVYITQKFGENPAIYKRFGMDGHNGVDYRTRFWDSPLGHRYVVASKRGKIIEAKFDNGYGNYVRMEHDLDGSGNEQTLYGHLKKWYVNVGDTVNQGQRIGLSDNTGFSTGPHLHWGYRPKGWKKIYGNGYKGYVDPLKFV